MLYFLFFILAMIFNWGKFYKDRKSFVISLVEASSLNHIEMILSHHFYIFIFEVFLGFIVAHLLTEGSLDIGLLGIGTVYLILLFLGFVIYKIFVTYLEKLTGIELWNSFKKNLLQEIRINLSLVFFPILIYSLINQTFHDEVLKDWGDLWFIGLIFNILFVSVLTIVCSVIVMLRIIPNREITEDSYLELINKRLEQIGKPNLRLRWIEADVKNAFVVGIKILKFNNQTMFLGRNLRNILTLDEFDAVICHELSHVANGHASKRLVDLIKNFLSIIMGSVFLVLFILMLGYFFWEEELILHSTFMVLISAGFSFIWFLFNYSLFFDSVRSHEFEADGFAVIKLGISYDSWKSALHKLTKMDDLPNYLKRKNVKSSNRYFQKLKSYFSTHPTVDERERFLAKKINKGLPFNFYVSATQRVRDRLKFFFKWRFVFFTSLVFLVTSMWIGFRITNGLKLISWVSNAADEEIMQDKNLIPLLSSSPTILGPPLSYYIVKNGNDRVIEYLLRNNVPPGKVILFLAEFKYEEKFQKYFSKYSSSISSEEYFLIMRKTAQVNFLNGYRFLVNSKKFEQMDPEYRKNVSRLIEIQRRPASEK